MCLLLEFCVDIYFGFSKAYNRLHYFKEKNPPSLITIGYDDGGNGLEKSWIFAVPYSGITKTRANSLLLCHSAIMFNNLIRKAMLLFPIIKAKTVHTSKTN